MIMSQTLPDRMRMCLYPILSIDQQYCHIQHRQASFHFRRKIHMAWCINQINLCIHPFHVSFLGINRNTMTSFLFIIVKDRIAMIDPSSLADCAAVQQHCFYTGRLARINVGKQSCTDMFYILHFTHVLSFFSDPFHSMDSMVFPDSDDYHRPDISAHHFLSSSSFCLLSAKHTAFFVSRLPFPDENQ